MAALNKYQSGWAGTRLFAALLLLACWPQQAVSEPLRLTWRYSDLHTFLVHYVPDWAPAADILIEQSFEAWKDIQSVAIQNGWVTGIGWNGSMRCKISTDVFNRGVIVCSRVLGAYSTLADQYFQVPLVTNPIRPLCAATDANGVSTYSEPQFADPVNCNGPYCATCPIKPTIELADASEVEPSNSLPFLVTVNSQETCPPVNVKISLKVDPRSGGHEHGDSKRPRGDIQGIHCDSDDTCWSSPAASGAVVFSFTAPEASGIHTITATCDECSNSPQSVTVDVKVKGLKPIPPSGLYALYEKDGSVIGAVAGRHPSNHYLQPAAANKLLIIAINYHHRYPKDPVIHVNDASLMWGGVFDIDTEAEWNEPHEEHKRGSVVDIRANSKDGAIPPANFDAFMQLAKDRRVHARIHSPGESNQHFHVRLLNRSE
ncbi:MAG: hypothetical protein HZB47_11860 [Nitrosomonadales bacterium]|nr:hypothetical protein [Nitrosomonadales bacterium]